MKGVCLKGRKSNVGALFPDFKKNPVIVRNAVGFLHILVVTFQKSIRKSVISQDALPEISAEKSVMMRRPICLDSSSSTHTHTHSQTLSLFVELQFRREGSVLTRDGKDSFYKLFYISIPIWKYNYS